jgi:hypothetical protein
MQSKTPTKLQKEWIQAQDQMTRIEDLTEALNDLTNLRSDFTNWNLGESIDNLAFELKRMNDRAEQK